MTARANLKLYCLDSQALHVGKWGVPPEGVSYTEALIPQNPGVTPEGLSDLLFTYVHLRCESQRTVCSIQWGAVINEP